MHCLSKLIICSFLQIKQKHKNYNKSNKKQTKDIKCKKNNKPSKRQIKQK